LVLWYFWLTIQNAAASQAHSLFRVTAVFISFCLAPGCAQRQEKRASPFLYAPDQLRVPPEKIRDKENEKEKRKKRKKKKKKKHKKREKKNKFSSVGLL
jgi:hypothetical protein